MTVCVCVCVYVEEKERETLPPNTPATVASSINYGNYSPPAAAPARGSEVIKGARPLDTTVQLKATD